MTSTTPSTSDAPSNGSRIRLRYAGKCGVCESPLAAGSTAYYARDAKKAYCDEHAPAAEAVASQQPAAPTPDPVGSASTAPTTANEPDQCDHELPTSITVRFAGTCSACMKALPKGAKAFYIRAAKCMVCVECTQLEVSLGLGLNGPGAGAARIADAASRRHAERLLAAYPMLGERLLENAKPPKQTKAWIRGADGERIVGKALDALVRDGRIEVLHDRVVPGTYSNFDHIVIGPRRITVIDAKHYQGATIRIKKIGSTRALYVDGQDAGHLIDGVRAQQAKLSDMLGPEFEEVLEASLAFVGANHGTLGTFGCRGVYCTTTKEVVARAAFSGWVPGNPKLKFEADQRREIRDRIAAAFPPNRS